MSTRCPPNKHDCSTFHLFNLPNIPTVSTNYPQGWGQHLLLPSCTSHPTSPLLPFMYPNIPVPSWWSPPPFTVLLNQHFPLPLHTQQSLSLPTHSSVSNLCCGHTLQKFADIAEVCKLLPSMPYIWSTTIHALHMEYYHPCPTYGVLPSMLYISWSTVLPKC